MFIIQVLDDFGECTVSVVDVRLTLTLEALLFERIVE